MFTNSPARYFKTSSWSRYVDSETKGAHLSIKHNVCIVEIWIYFTHPLEVGKGKTTVLKIIGKCKPDGQIGHNITVISQKDGLWNAE